MKRITKTSEPMLKRYMYVLMILVMCMVVLSANAQTDPINIKQAIDIAFANNYGLRADSLNITSAVYKNKQLKGSYLPQVNLGGNVDYNPAIPSQMLPGAIAGDPSKDLVPVKFGTKYNAGGGIEVTQNIYRKDLLLQIRSAGLNTDIAQTKYNLSREDLVYEVASSFYSLESAAELIRTTTTDYNNLKNILRIAKAQFENGTMKRIDYESLEINVANKESQLKKYTTQYNEQLNYFKYILGLSANAVITINDSVTAQHFSTVTPGGSLFSQREDIHLYHQMIQSKEVEMKSIKAEGFPVLSSYFRFQHQGQFNSAGKAFDNDYWYNSSKIGVSVNVALFDGNRRKNRVNVARTELEQLKWQKEQQQQRAQTELLTATATLDNNQEQYRLNSNNLALAEKVFASRSALYTEGVSTLMELLDAEKELSEARTLYIQSMINVQTGILDVHKANGTLLTEFVKSL